MDSKGRNSCSRRLGRSQLFTVAVILALCLVMVLSGGAGAEDGNAPETVEVQASVFSGAINYQGQLLVSEEPVNDDCGMIFSLYDSKIGGSVVGTPISTTVTVTDGLFSADLSFGSNAFNGEGRWLGIQVKGSEDTGFTSLGRQELVPAPYAQYSLKAGTATTALTADTATTALSASTAVTATTAMTATVANSAGNADTVDGLHGSNMARVTHYFIGYPGGTQDIAIPHYQVCQIVIGEVFAHPDQIAWLAIAENDFEIAWVGLLPDGTSVHGTAALGSTNTIITVGSYITLSCPGDSEYKLVLTSTRDDVVATVTW